MTMKDKKCDVCGVNEPIGVPSTLMPYSVAYCVECAKRDAQPLVVFETLIEDADRADDWVNELETYTDGKYITFAEWAAKRKHDHAD